MTHICHATGCSVPVAPSLLMCKRHWYMVPAELRNAVWATYRRGQERDKNPSKAYLEAARAAVATVAERERKKPDTTLYDAMLAVGERQ